MKIFGVPKREKSEIVNLEKNRDLEKFLVYSFLPRINKNLSAGRGRPDGGFGDMGVSKISIFDRFYKGFRHGEMPCAFYL